MKVMTTYSYWWNKASGNNGKIRWFVLHKLTFLSIRCTVNMYTETSKFLSAASENTSCLFWEQTSTITCLYKGRLFWLLYIICTFVSCKLPYSLIPNFTLRLETYLLFSQIYTFLSESVIFDLIVNIAIMILPGIFKFSLWKHKYNALN